MQDGKDSRKIRHSLAAVTSMGVFAAFVGAGSWITASRIEDHLEGRARGALEDAGITASVHFAGRDALLAGTVPSAAESARARILVADLPGVRRVESRLQVGPDGAAAPTPAAESTTGTSATENLAESPTHSPGESPSGPSAGPAPDSAPGSSSGSGTTVTGPTPKPSAVVAEPVPQPILFGSGEAEPGPESLDHLTAVAAYLRNVPNAVVTIQGHSDNIGPRAMNRELSLLRARTVADRLVALGVDAARVRTEAFADTRPVASNRTAAGRAANRRVEIVFEGVQ